MTHIDKPAGVRSRVRISRRRFVAATAAAAATLAAAGVAGCGGVADGSRPRRGGTLRTGTSLPLASGLDPQIENATGLAIFPRVYGYALHVDPRDDTTILDHAESVEQPDATTYVIRLRDGVPFQDIPPANGRPVTAHDFIRSVERYRDNPLVTSKTWHETVLDQIAAADDRTVLATTKRPYVYSLGALGDINAGAILPAELVDSVADLTAEGAGSGPFAIDAVSLSGATRIVRNGGYYRSPLPYLDAMVWHVYPSDAEKLDQFRARGLDAITLRDRREADTVRAPGNEVQVAARPSLGYLSLGFRCDRMPFADWRVRRAIDLALDRAQLISDAVDGDADALGPVNQHLASGYWSLGADVVAAASGADRAYGERLADAKLLLTAAAATSPSFGLKVAALPQLIDVAEIIRSRLTAIGALVTVERLDVLSWFTAYRGGDFEAILISQPPWESPDLAARMYHSGGPTGRGSPFALPDPQVDALVERSWGEGDRDQRRSTLLEAQRLMLDARPLLQLFSGTSYAAAQANVRGLEPDLPGSLQQYSYGQWLA